METFTHASKIEKDLDMLSTEMCMEEISSIAIPLQQMFDEFMVFISKTDFEQ